MLASQQPKPNTRLRMLTFCPAGEPTTDITEQDGKRIIKRTGMYTGTELHLIRYAEPHTGPQGCSGSYWHVCWPAMPLLNHTRNCS
jgi:hypothetical protein